MTSDSLSRIHTPGWKKYEWLIPLALFGLFLAVTLPGISWGAPKIWHPDEVVYLAREALHGNPELDDSNYNHPHLPIYMMIGLGKVVMALGGGDGEVLIASRVLSAVMIGLTIVLAYLIPRRMGYNALVSGMSGLIAISISALPHNGRFAHNDTFVTFFSTLTIFLLLQYKITDQRGWLYATFFAAGLAVSSKYSALSLAVVPAALYLWNMRKVLLKETLRILETLFIGSALTYFGYAVGTPQALFWMAYYFKRLIPALIYNGQLRPRTRQRQRHPGTVCGDSGGVGTPLYSFCSSSP